jgi:hypothetical protein
MVYSPVVWAFKDQITSAKLAQMQENIRAHDHRADGSQGAASPFVLLGGGTAAAIPINTYTPVSFPEANEVTDPLAMHVAGNLTRITIPVGMGGVYVLAGNGTWSAGSATRRIVAFSINGAPGYAANEIPVAGAGAFFQATAGLRLLAAGDYVELTPYAGVAGLTFNAALLSATLIART